MMNEDQEKELLENIKSITDRLDIVDKIFAANRLGHNMVMAFQCGESGLYYPADYIKRWGQVYGIGLGPHPVSESLQSEYDVSPPLLTPEIQDLTQLMHPLRVSGAQMDLDLVDNEHYLANAAILVSGDPLMRKRVPILYEKQCKNPRGRLGQARAAWAMNGRLQ